MTTRDERVAALRDRILDTAPDIARFDSVDELARESVRNHVRELAGDQGPAPTELRVRLHGDGVREHQVPVGKAAPILRDLQMAITWIASGQRQVDAVRSDQQSVGVRLATQLFLQPQVEPGSVVFELVASQPADSLFAEDAGADQSTLTAALRRLLGIMTIAERDGSGSIAQLNDEVATLSSRASSALNRMAKQLTEAQIDLDLGIRDTHGARSRANLGRRGALAISDAANRTRSEIERVVLVGRLETISLGRDPVRVVRDDGSNVRLSVGEATTYELGPLLGERVTVRADLITTRRATGTESRRYFLVDVVRDSGQE